MASDSKEVEVDMAPLFRLYKDGTVYRQDPYSRLLPSPEPDAEGVASKDITLDAARGLWVRIFLPGSPTSLNLAHEKLPLVLIFHGGGFVFGNPAWSNFHMFCVSMAKRSHSIVVSASYRLAPEHRFPAAFEDGFSALKWLHSQSIHQSEGNHELTEPWLISADFSRCFIAGESAGGTLAYHVARMAFNTPYSVASWMPMCMEGLVLIHPGFMRGTRTQEELDSYQDVFMNWNTADACIQLTLPQGCSIDNSYFNPLPIVSSPDCPFTLPKTLILLADKDALHFYVLQCVEALKDACCQVDVVMEHGVGHVFFIAQPDSEQAQHMTQSIDHFINKDHKVLL
ncbi:hypothetical protein KP509_14G005900 [Ceratopteris richardii]|uniref:Alpha/beta hydrolase fold-3 domain-containing protein n=2 Tax=Ceratopteris richardii TaxID=49495 RepID=A0A8T2T7M0_CERRI|nr:hypothetical protein KP509_14G005900 [Ceratopteris richardii]